MAWIAFDLIFQEKVLEMEQAYPVEISFQDLTHRTVFINCLLTVFFRVNGKQPMLLENNLFFTEITVDANINPVCLRPVELS